MQLQLKSDNLKEAMSKNKKQDKVGPLEDSAGNIISQGFLMAEDLNGLFQFSVYQKSY